MSHSVQVLVPMPAHASLAPLLDYSAAQALPPGTLVRVPLGKRETLGIVWDASPQDAAPAAAQQRAVVCVLDAIAPLGPDWRELVRFAARYYQRALGEVALAALPPALRNSTPETLSRRQRRASQNDAAEPAADAVALTPQQEQALRSIADNAGPFLLFGATGSGKTEVYMHAVERLLAQDASAQALIMVPEINLTPQLEQRFRARFCATHGAHAVVSLHSGTTPAQRLRHWLAAHQGKARIVLGTRLAVFASLPGLRLIVVDEEHDPSYKSGDGARYSARDLAVYRAQQLRAKVVLGSATPSLESWYRSRPPEEGGRYLRLHMPSRVGAQAHLPLIRRVDMRKQPRNTVFSGPLLDAIKACIERGEQCLVFLNRRGYAPVLHCADCGWNSECPNCSVYRVFHKIDRTLRCHHCSHTERVPRACPACGNPDIAPLGRGTEQLEESMVALLADVRRPGTQSADAPEGLGARVARIDADSTRHKGALEQQLAAVHAGEVDVLVGTQMIAKGHDFRRITLVAAINPDTTLFSSDFRAPERLFGLLLQAAGRAGRDARLGAHSEVWIQTAQPEHPLYAALKAYDYPRFAEQQLAERAQAGMPPFSAQALLRAEARTQQAAQAFLNLARASALEDMAQWPGWERVLAHITLYPAVPMAIARVAAQERAQLLVESSSRTALQQFLAAWQDILHATRARPECKGLLRWAIDVDPQAV